MFSSSGFRFSIIICKEKVLFFQKKYIILLKRIQKYYLYDNSSDF